MVVGIGGTQSSHEELLGGGYEFSAIGSIVRNTCRCGSSQRPHVLSVRAARQRMSTYQCQQSNSFIFASFSSLTLRPQGYDNFGTFYASSPHSHVYLTDVGRSVWMSVMWPCLLDSSRTSLTKRSNLSHMSIQNVVFEVLVHDMVRTFRHSEWWMRQCDETLWIYFCLAVHENEWLKRQIE